QLRIGARLEGEGAEDRPVRVDRRVELVGDVEEAERRLGAGLADRDPARANESRAVPELEPALAAVDDETLLHGMEIERAGSHPPRAPVRTARHRDPVPG